MKYDCKQEVTYEVAPEHHFLYSIFVIFNLNRNSITTVIS